MKEYWIINRTTDNISLIIPAPSGSGRQYASLTLPGSGAIDIMPYAGTVENCKRASAVHDLEVRGIVKVVIK